MGEEMNTVPEVELQSAADGGQKNSKKVWIWILVSCALVIIIGVVIYIWPKVFQETTELTVELGEPLTTDIYDYVRGDEKLIAEARLDITKVDQTKAGEYEASVTYTRFLFHSENTYVYQIHIVDTIAPEIKVIAAPYYIGQGQPHDVEEFITSCTDASNDVTISVVGQSNNIIQNTTLGTYKFQISAKDPSDNETIVEVAVEVDTVPQFLNLRKEAWYLSTDLNAVEKSVFAYDEAEGLLCETNEEGLLVFPSLQLVNKDEVQRSADIGGKNHDINAHFIVEDCHGITNEGDMLVHVVQDKKDIPADFRVGLNKEDMEILCKYDLFSYEPLKEENYDQMIKLVEPCLFDMWKGLTQKQIEQGYTGQYSGSGFILDITPEYIYAITDEHCVKSMHDRTNFIFWTHGELKDCTYESITTYKMKGYGADASLFRMDVSAIPADVMINLKKAYTDQNVYDNLQKGQEVVSYAKFWKSGDDRINRLKVLSNNANYDRWPGKMLTTSSGVKPGMSGTGTFDLKGNLVGVVYATYTNNGVVENWHAPLDAVLYLSEHRGELDGKKVAGAPATE